MTEASSRCPICGVDTPHEHDAITVKEYRDEELRCGKKKLEEFQKIVDRRQKVDATFRSELQRLMDEAIAAKANYEAACPCCRIARVSDEFIKDMIGTLIIYDYGWREEAGGDLVYCPECGSCLWDRT